MAVAAFLSLLALLALQAAAQQVTYFKIGGSLTLNPNHPEPITSITWKHKGNIVAEHFKGVVELDYLGDFKDRAELDKTTGILTIRNLRKSDDGKFTVEINHMVLPVQFDAVGINPIPGPIEIIVRPLTCNSDAQNCILLCGEFQDVGPVKYFWKKGETGKWEEGDERLVISRETEQVETFTCRAENPFSNVTSAPHNNPYHKKPADNSPLVFLLVPLVILAAGAAGVSAWLIIKKPQWVQNLLNRQSGQPTENRKELEGLNSDRNPESGVLHPKSPEDS